MTNPVEPREDAKAVIPTVLVVEDEPVIRELMSMLLEDEGYVVHQAVDGLEALETVERHSVDLVLSDVKMPRLDGASLAHQLRSRDDAIPIVLMSAVYAEVDLPGVRFLRKPIDCEQLLGLIATIIQEAGRAAKAVERGLSPEAASPHPGA